jgi:hypothetical protein
MKYRLIVLIGRLIIRPLYDLSAMASKAYCRALDT